jgi:hypothetical protein
MNPFAQTVATRCENAWSRDVRKSDSRAELKCLLNYWWFHLFFICCCVLRWLPFRYLPQAVCSGELPPKGFCFWFSVLFFFRFLFFSSFHGCRRGQRRGGVLVHPESKSRQSPHQGCNFTYYTQYSILMGHLSLQKHILTHHTRKHLVY